MAAGTSFESGDSADSTTGLTLKRLAVWTEDVALRMRLMSTIIESCRGKNSSTP